MTSSADWQNVAVMTGGASGALTGLLFVAVSLNASRIAGHQGLRASAAQTLVLFLAPLVMATVLLVPGQADWVLGAEVRDPRFTEAAKQEVPDVTCGHFSLPLLPYGRFGR
jgi:hypothetical protein